jgi:hypothetical protein
MNFWRSYLVMKKKLTWLFSSLLVLAAMLMLPHLVFAENDGLHKGWDPHPFHWPHPGDDTPAAPEIDPRLAVEGIAIAGGAVALVWEGIRRRRR